MAEAIRNSPFAGVVHTTQEYEKQGVLFQPSVISFIIPVSGAWVGYVTPFQGRW